MNHLKHPIDSKRSWGRIVLGSVAVLAVALISWLLWLGTGPPGVTAAKKRTRLTGSELDGAWIEGRGRPRLEGIAALPEGNRSTGAGRLGVRLAGDGRLAGRVVDVATSLPVNDPLIVELLSCPPALTSFVDDALRIGKVSEELQAQSQPIAVVRTQTGEFEFEGVRKGHYDLVARGTNWAPCGSVRARVSSTGDGGPVVVRVQAGGALEGRVLTPAGESVPGARVALSTGLPVFFEAARRGDLVRDETRADSAGRFRFESLPACQAYVLMATGEGILPSPELEIPVTAGRTTQRDITLRIGGRVEGRVLLDLESGEEPVPLAGALVGAIPRSLRDPFVADAILERCGTQTDAGGRYVLEGVVPGEVDVLAIAGGATGGTTGPVLLGPGGLAKAPDLVLQESPMIEGRVVDSEGQPISGVEVRWDPSEWWKLEGSLTLAPLFYQALPGFRFPVTDSTGRFLAGPFPGKAPFGLYFISTGYVLRVVQVDPAQADSPLEIELTRGGAIEGLVMDLSSAEPVTSFTVESVATGYDDPTAPNGWNPFSGGTLFEDPKGRFLLELLEPGEVELEIHAPGFVSTKLKANVVDGETTRGKIVLLKRGALVSGSVLDESGAPVAGAHVFAEDEQGASRFGRRPSNRGLPVQGNEQVNRFLTYGPTEVFAGLGLLGDSAVTTDEQGRFELAGIRPGQVFVRANHRNHALGSSGPLVLAEGEQITDLELVLEAGATLTGWVEDLDGLPVSGAIVGAFGPPTRSRARLYQATTDAEGRYRIEHMQPGALFVGVTRGDLAGSIEGLFGRLSFDLVTIPERGEVELNLIDLTGGGVRVFGRISERGEPVEAGSLIASRTDADIVLGIDLKMTAVRPGGEFEFESLAPGDYVFSLQSDDGPVRCEATIPDVSEVRIELELPTSSIRGRLVDEATGEAVAGAHVVLEREDSDSGEGLLGTFLRGDQFSEYDRSSKNGVFSFERVPPGFYLLQVLTDEQAEAVYAPIEPLRIEVGEHERIREVLVRLHPGLTLTGTVSSFDGGPLVNPWVEALSLESGSRFHHQGLVQNDGSFAVPGLLPGPYEVTARSDQSGVTQVVEVGPNTAPISLVLESRLVVTIRVVDPGGRPAAGAVVRLVPVNSLGEPRVQHDLPLYEALSGQNLADQKGVLRVEDVLPGRYRILASARGARGELTSVDLNADSATRDLILRLNP